MKKYYTCGCGMEEVITDTNSIQYELELCNSCYRKFIKEHYFIPVPKHLMSYFVMLLEAGTMEVFERAKQCGKYIDYEEEVMIDFVERLSEKFLR